MKSERERRGLTRGRRGTKQKQKLLFKKNQKTIEKFSQKTT
jgi:hypothetical protein